MKSELLVWLYDRSFDWSERDWNDGKSLCHVLISTRMWFGGLEKVKLNFMYETDKNEQTEHHSCWSEHFVLGHGPSKHIESDLLNRKLLDVVILADKWMELDGYEFKAIRL